MRVICFDWSMQALEHTDLLSLMLLLELENMQLILLVEAWHGRDQNLKYFYLEPSALFKSTYTLFQE